MGQVEIPERFVLWLSAMAKNALVIRAYTERYALYPGSNCKEEGFTIRFWLLARYPERFHSLQYASCEPLNDRYGRQRRKIVVEDYGRSGTDGDSVADFKERALNKVWATAYPDWLDAQPLISVVFDHGDKSWNTDAVATEPLMTHLGLLFGALTERCAFGCRCNISEMFRDRLGGFLQGQRNDIRKHAGIVREYLASSGI